MTASHRVPTFIRAFEAALNKRVSEEVACVTMGMGLDEFRLANALREARKRMIAIGVVPSPEKIRQELAWDEPTLENAEKALQWLDREVDLQEPGDRPEA